jgi:putative ABC transport system substrate-binding protein
MKRREVIALLSGAVAWPFAARAQQRGTPRVGIVTIQERKSPPYAAFDQRLRELGYVDGQNLAVEFLSPGTQIDGAREAMQELIRRKVDVILATTQVALKSAMTVTATLPIVMLAIDYDPLASGYVNSLARPGGNVTGLFTQQIELTVKRIQLSKDAFPDVQAATVFWDTLSVDQWKATETAGARLGWRLAGIELREQPYDYERALAQAPPDHRGVLIVPTSPIFYRDRQRLADLAIRHRMGSMFVLREWVEAGGLMSYGVNFPALFRRAAEFVDKILKGARTSDLPVEQPTKFEFVINLKTATALGFNLPPGLLAIVDEVIE